MNQNLKQQIPKLEAEIAERVMGWTNVQNVYGHVQGIPPAGKFYKKLNVIQDSNAWDELVDYLVKTKGIIVREKTAFSKVSQNIENYIEILHDNCPPLTTAHYATHREARYHAMKEALPKIVDMKDEA